MKFIIGRTCFPSYGIHTCFPSYGTLRFPLQMSIAQNNSSLALADLGVACWVHAPPYGTQFFCFCIHFH